MQLKTLLLRNFRNYSHFKVNFSSNLNIISGENAVGKTNLIEAIHLLSTGKSFKTSNFKNLIKDKEKYFYIEAEINNQNVDQVIKIYYDGITKKISLNATSYPTFSSLLGILPSILLSDEDLNLIKGDPLIRRKFLNQYLMQQDPLYVHHYFRFFKALKQRNHLLKNNKIELLSFFDKELVKSGAYLIYKRKFFLKNLQKTLPQILNEISKTDLEPKIRYISSIALKNEISEISQTYLEVLKKNRRKEISYKTSLFGPHRDDFLIHIFEKLAKIYASEGQKKLLLYALKIAQNQLLYDELGQRPLLLIDDYEAHLDKVHEANLKKYLSKLSQVFLTMPKTDKKFDNANYINIQRTA